MEKSNKSVPKAFEIENETVQYSTCQVKLDFPLGFVFIS